VSRTRLPETLCNLGRRNLQVPPPRLLIAAAVQFVVILTAQRNSEFVAHLSAENFGLGEFEVVGIAWGALADEARLRCSNESQVRFISTT
jgi:hypothetical protein